MPKRWGQISPKSGKCEVKMYDEVASYKSFIWGLINIKC